MNDLPLIAPDKRVLGVIRPSTEIVGNLSKNKNVGILATAGTVKSGSYSIELEKFFPKVKVTEQACPMWVPLIENNEHNSDPGREFIKRDFEKLLQSDSDIDTVVLACTHYPLVESYLKSIAPEGVHIISQGAIVAESLKDYMLRHPEMDERCSKEGKIQFLTTEHPSSFDDNASQFYGDRIQAEQIDL